jgi:kynureninase
MGLPQRIGAKISRLIGADADEVIVADSTSVNLFKLSAAALKMRPGRQVVVSEAGNFPTDLYVLEGLIDFLGGDLELRTAAPGELETAIDQDVALVLLTHVNYRSGQVHDMAGITARAHAAGALVVWDLCHSAGALELDLNGCGVDLAVGCGYKFLNGGPGAPAFIYVAKALQAEVQPVISGWMGHAAPFDFAGQYRPSDGMNRNLSGTPPVIALSVLEAGVDSVLQGDIRLASAKARRLGDLFLQRIAETCAGRGFELACPRDGERRGAQVSLSHADGEAITQALIARGVTGDFRPPDVLRFGLAPMYTRYVDVYDATEIIAEITA